MDNVQVRECPLDLGQKVVIDSQPNHSALRLTDEQAGFFEFRDVMREGGLGDPHLIEYGTAGDPLSAGVCAHSA